MANEELGTTVRAAATVDNETNKRMRGLLEQIENKVFDSKPRFYAVFKQMDTDNDGFIRDHGAADGDRTRLRR